MKNELPTGVIIAAIVGLLVVAGIGIFFALGKGDPAARAPNPTPHFDAAQKSAESSKQNPMMERGPQSLSDGAQKPGATVQ